MESTPVGFGLANYISLGVYIVGTLVLGIWFTRRNRTTVDYFRAGQRIPWWVVGISLSNVSSISYMSLPAKAFAGDWSVALVNVPIFLIVPVVAYVFLPLFAALQSASAYEFLERRFGLSVRLYGSTSFVLFQLIRMALVLYMPALAVSAVTDLNIYACILLVGLCSALYSALGGLEGVVWTDFAQTIFLVGAAFLSFGLVVYKLDGGFGELMQIASANDKFRIAKWEGDITSDPVWVVLTGGFFLAMTPYVSDQSMIQRFINTKDLQASRQALWTNGALALVNTFIFLSVGTAIFVYYQGKAHALDGLAGPDAILPFFIAHELPAGVAGVVIAAIFAAAQSAIATSLNSTATVIVTDYAQRLGRPRPDAEWLRLAKWLTASIGVVVVALAILLATVGIRSAFDAAQRIVGLTTSGLAGIFLLSMLHKRANSRAAWSGLIASTLILYWVQMHTNVHVYLYSLVGIVVCVATGLILSISLPATFAHPTSPAAAPGLLYDKEATQQE